MPPRTSVRVSFCFEGSIAVEFGTYVVDERVLRVGQVHHPPVPMLLMCGQAHLVVLLQLCADEVQRQRFVRVRVTEAVDVHVIVAHGQIVEGDECGVDAARLVQQ